MKEDRLFVCERILLEDHFLNGGILVDDQGKILKIFDKDQVESFLSENEDITVFNYGNNVLMPGIIDSHVHINEPGRTEWEGFETATKAGAAGGITTIVDMPLNSIPPTTTMENLKAKINAAKNKTYVDVAFWGGVVPGNENELVNMAKAGVVGFKCFLTPSGVDEFQHVDMPDVEKALKVLENTNVVLAFHAEVEEENIIPTGKSTSYETFLETRPASMEENAIKKVIDMAKRFKVRTHIVHLSAASALPIIEQAKINNKLLTVETCHHYLSLDSKMVPEKATEFKCCPPIRNSKNQDQLWEALKFNVIDMVVSDHSPSTPDLKLLNSSTNCGDFLKAWGGIASVQFGLSLFWTESTKRGFKIFDINKYMTRPPAKLVGLHKQKGRIQEKFDADFVVWDPESEIVIEESIIHHKNKITPYLGKKLKGKVLATVVRGEIVYEHGKDFDGPMGKLLVSDTVLY